MITKSFFEQLDTIAESRRLEKEDVLQAVKIAIIKGVQAEGHTGIIEVEFNEEQKKVRISETGTNQFNNCRKDCISSDFK